MLSDHEATPMVAVKDLSVARKFYSETLGLKQLEEAGPEVIVYKTGSGRLNVYRSDYAGTNKATTVTWQVGDQLASIVEELKVKGVEFAHYDIPGFTHEGDVHVSGHMRAAWFTDPDGNIFSLIAR